MPTLRLFISIDTPPKIKSLISRVISKIKETGADVKWEPPEKLHATIKFLGNADEGLVGRIASVLEEICVRQDGIDVRYANLGCFPERGQPRVIWIGIEDRADALKRLNDSIEDVMATIGFSREERKFTPHLTIGRVKGRKNLHRLLTRMETITFESEPVVIGELALMKSELGPGGSVYTTLKLIPFGNRAPG